MALIAHWPLTGHLNDISGNGYHLQYNANSGKLLETNSGKIGKAYYRATKQNGSDWFGTSENILLSGDVTMAVWAKVTDVHNGTANGILSQHNHATNSGLGITIKEVSSSDYRISCTTGTGSSRTYYSYYGTTNIKDKWTHLVLRFTKETNEITLWVNGIKEYTVIYNQYNKSDKIGLFMWSLGTLGSDYRPASYLNDARIYDHALSEMEIKELSKGLILHYAFDDSFGINIMSGMADMSGIANITNNTTEKLFGKYIINRATLTSGTYKDSVNFQTPILNAHKYTLSFWARGSVDNTVRCHLYSPNTPTKVLTSTGDIRTATDGLAIVNITTEWKKYWVKWDMEATGTRKQVIVGRNQGTLGSTVEIAGVKFEKGHDPSDFSENEDLQYIRDSSGFGNDSDLLDDIYRGTWSSESAVGLGSAEFDRNPTSSEFRGPSITPSDNITMSAWIYPRTLTTTGSIIRKDNGYLLQFDSTGSFRPHVYTDSSWKNISTSANTIKINQWQLVSATYDGTKLKAYVNGSKISEMNVTGTIGDAGYNITIGNHTGVEQFDGFIDDVRIYATALTDEDIMKLYKTRAELSNDGTLYSKAVLEDIRPTYNILHHGNPIKQESYTPYVATTSGTWQDKHPNAIRAYNYLGQDITGFINSGVTDWTNTYHAIWEYDPYWDKPVAVMRNLDGGVWKSSTRGIGTPFNQLGLTHGSQYTISWDQWVDNINVTAMTGVYGLNLTGGNGFHDGQQSPKNKQPNRWERVSCTFTVSSNRNITSATSLSIYQYGQYGAAGTIKLANIQMEVGDQATPFTDIYRPPSQLPSSIDFNKPGIHETGTWVADEVSTVGITEGMVGYWPLDGNAKDYSGSNNDGAVIGASKTTGLIDGAYDFNYTNLDRVSLSSFNNLNFREGLTISAFIKSNDITKSQNIVSRNGPYFLRITSSTIRCAVLSGTWVFANGSIQLQSNQWYHLVLTYDQNKMRGYVNGILDVDVDKTGLLNNAADHLFIGYTTASGENSAFDGIIDEVKIFNRALTPEEIKIEYNTMFNNKMQIHDSGTLYAKDIEEY